MEKIKKILFPVDLSEVSAKICPYVNTMAEKFDAEVHLLFVSRIFDYFVSIYVPHPSIDVFEEEVRQGAIKRLDEFKEENFSKEKIVKTVVTSGDAAEQILKYIEKEKIDMVIMGTHGRKGLDRVIFGSVANGVSKMATAPVLLVNPYRVKWLADKKKKK